ncbi:hypothetical protein FZC74_07675 [Sutcliffiella horikoshii]|uniref:Uncharacterized protein n=1 Tax=Sutcliffiella horikoshii TaxID=79883 RepID=A0AA94WPW4_9BACI|nr:hypothetical protein FZC74_07675 [Sutcliffiella horikoshii]
MQWKARRRPREEGTGETPQRSEEAHGPPAGKRSAWNGNQPFISQSSLFPLLKRHHRIKLLLVQTA